MKIPRILLTSGEPAGIGPDILAQIAQENWDAEIIVIGDPDLLLSRARQLQLPLSLLPFDEKSSPQVHSPSVLKIVPIPLNTPCEAGKLNKENASYVIRLLDRAGDYAASWRVDAIVTAPVHKALLNEGGFVFQGHTEFFGKWAEKKATVMLFVTQNSRVALATTHLPLAQVAQSITKELLEKVLQTLHQSLVKQFGMNDPVIYVCGLNPHAGEGGYLGREEIDIIHPVLEMFHHQQKQIIGPLPADTIFTEKYLKKADAILAMYHDQALPVVKYMGFGHAVNVTLGLPFIRTSVDHGTALDLAGTLGADSSSLQAAVELAIKLSLHHHHR